MIEVDLDLDRLSPEQADAAMSKIFLTAQDDLSALVSGYWAPCVREAAAGQDGRPRFSAEFKKIPGVMHAPGGTTLKPATEASPLDCTTRTRVKKGVYPRLIHNAYPEYSERARRAKLQGAVILKLVVNEEGLPTNIRIIKPLGLGLDEKAIGAVREWRFKPAEKDGRPIPMEIATQVEFHMY